MRPLPFPAAVLLSALPALALAQGGGESPMSAIKAPAAASPGEPVSMVIEAGPSPSRWCGLQVDFGDGEVREVKINPRRLFPVTVEKTYQAPGRYTVRVSGKQLTSHIACLGTPSTQIAIGGGGAPAPSAAVNSSCPATVTIRNTAGQDVPFGLRQMVVDAGGVQRAREQVNQRLMDVQAKALDDSAPAAERENAKQFAYSLRIVRDQLAKCQ